MIDPNGSSVRFATRHLFGLAPVRGTFAIASGEIAVTEPIGESRVQVEIDAAGFHTRSRRRDETVRGPGFLDSAHYPTITFRGEGVEFDDAGGTVPGTMTVRDATRPVTLRLTGWDLVGRSSRGTRSFVARATTRIDRRAFGITASRGMAGRYLDISIQITCLPS